MMSLINTNAINVLKKTANKTDKFYRDIITFDIETTSLSEQISFMYAFTVCINGTSFYGREWSEFQQFINNLNRVSKVDKMFVVWIHNLSFEFRFMESYIKFDKVFATDAHKVIYAISGNVMFRCSYYMSNLPLEKLYKTYKLKTPKLSGQLDYRKIRTYKTPLTDQEWAYIENDGVLLYEYIEYILKECGSFSVSKMPLTSTGFTRLYLRDKANSDNAYGILRKIVKEASPRNMEFYNTLRRAFAGGYVHANWIWLKQTIKDVTSLDKTSFYPAVMCKEKFPRQMHKMKSSKFYDLINNPDYAVVADVAFYGLEAKTTQTIISKHKCSYIRNDKYVYNKSREKDLEEEKDKTKKRKKISKPPIFDNGRVRSADCLVITITDLDFDSICKFYDFKYIKVGRVYAGRKRYLPKTFIETTLELYALKTTLKDVVGEEIVYQMYKARLNSLYGVCVSDILQPVICYNQEDFTWGNEPLKGDELNKYIDKYTSIYLYQTGVFITAYCRHEILEHCLELDEDNIYNDTDSIKLVNYEEHKKYFDDYDKKVIRQLEDACDYYGIDKSLLNPCDKYGQHHHLGVLSNEGTYSKFKTLGCKRYIYELDGELHSTVAGMPKDKMTEYLLKFPDPFEAFNQHMTIPAEETGKNTHYYTLPHDPMEITDYLGNKTVQEIGTGISLIPQEFKINLASEFCSFLKYSTNMGLHHQERFEKLSDLTKRRTLWE